MTEFQEAAPTPAGPPRPPAGAPSSPPPPPPSPSHPAANPDAGVVPTAFGAPPPDLREAVVQVLQTCYDPEIPVNIFDLGLVYGVEVTPENDVTVRMTLTSPSCPVAGTLPPDVERKVREIPGVRSAKVDLVWEPPWGKHLLSEAARLQLGLDGY